MKIGKKLNTLLLQEYLYYIDNHRKYKDFNTLGLYRSIVEHKKLTLDEKIVVRDHAHKIFRKTFDFLQIKDPKTYVDVKYLGQVLTQGDVQNIWEEVIKNQQRMLADKRIKHRNFGNYSKHNCGYPTCPWNGLMVRQGSWVAESSMHFSSDKFKYPLKLKSLKRRSDRKNKKQIIRHEIERD